MHYRQNMHYREQPRVLQLTHLSFPLVSSPPHSSRPPRRTCSMHRSAPRLPPLVIIVHTSFSARFATSHRRMYGNVSARRAAARATRRQSHTLHCLGSRWHACTSSAEGPAAAPVSVELDPVPVRTTSLVRSPISKLTLPPPPFPPPAPPAPPAPPPPLLPFSMRANSSRNNAALANCPAPPAAASPSPGPSPGNTGTAVSRPSMASARARWWESSHESVGLRIQTAHPDSTLASPLIMRWSYAYLCTRREQSGEPQQSQSQSQSQSQRKDLC